MPKFKPNAYGEFVSEFRKQKALSNVNYPSFEAASKDAGVIWQNMSAMDKEKYKSLAQKHKDKLQSNSATSNNNPNFSKVNGKKTCQGRLLVEVDYLEKQRQEFAKKKKLYTQNLMKNIPELLNHEFFIMHSIPYLSDEFQTFHAEIALAKFTLNSGITSTQQMFINHDQLPTGYIHDAQSRFDREHHIVLPPHGKNVLKAISYLDAYDKISNFLQLDKDGFYHIYTKEEDIKVIEHFFEKVSHEIGNSNLDKQYLIHDYMDLFFYLMKTANESHEKNQPDSVYRALTKEKITIDRYDMKKVISCEYHKEVDYLPCCSLSKVQRWIFYICETVCNSFHIYMLEGRHFPLGIALKQVFPKQLTNVNDSLAKASLNLPAEAKTSNTAHNSSSTVTINSGESQMPENTNYLKPNVNNNDRYRKYYLDASSSKANRRNGSTASTTRLGRGGNSHKCLIKDKHESSSSDDLDLPHNDIDYANLKKPWEAAMSAKDVDPTLFDSSSSDDEGIQLIDQELSALDIIREVPLRDRFPKRKINIAANFDNQMD